MSLSGMSPSGGARSLESRKCLPEHGEEVRQVRLGHRCNWAIYQGFNSLAVSELGSATSIKKMALESMLRAVLNAACRLLTGRSEMVQSRHAWGAHQLQQEGQEYHNWCAKNIPLKVPAMIWRKKQLQANNETSVEILSCWSLETNLHWIPIKKTVRLKPKAK